MSVLKEITCMWKETRVPPEISEHIRKAKDALSKLEALQSEMIESGSNEISGGDVDNSDGGDDDDDNNATNKTYNKESLQNLLLQVREELEISLNKSNETIYPKSSRVRKLYFHFITRGQHSLMWFGNELQRVAAVDPEKRIHIHIHLTRTKTSESPFQMRLLRLAQKTGRHKGVDAISNLQHAKTSLGRPNWDEVFSSIYEQHRIVDTNQPAISVARKKRLAKRIGVFFCGPEAIRAALDKKCTAYSHLKDGPDWILHSEKF
jgi:hypothetical protein